LVATERLTEELAMLSTSEQSKTPITMSEDFSSGVLSATGAALEDRRACARVPRRMGARIVGAGVAETTCCTTEDISEGGAYVCVPSQAGLRVGQRYELVLFAEESPTAAAISIDPVYATVVRTHLVKKGCDQYIGAGFRFDQPLYL
jgi:hypothetical protein